MLPIVRPDDLSLAVGVDRALRSARIHTFSLKQSQHSSQRQEDGNYYTVWSEKAGLDFQSNGRICSLDGQVGKNFIYCRKLLFIDWIWQFLMIGQDDSIYSCVTEG